VDLADSSGRMQLEAEIQWFSIHSAIIIKISDPASEGISRPLHPSIEPCPCFFLQNESTAF
jgi:hypothetical protein